MPQIIECVPNFSEGRDTGRIAAIADAVRAVRGIRVLDLSSDPDHNRSVLTLVGDGESLLRGVHELFGASIGRIDLRHHQGGHPRMGAVDVVPFVPIQGASMPDCVNLARRCGERIAGDFGVPVFLYEEAATSEARQNLSNIRKGEFEGLAEKMKQPEWAPDFGPAVPHPTAGAVAVGARPFLIAYNINLATSDLTIAEAIARAIRQVSGGFRYCKAMGVALADRGIVQVSINMTNYKKTPLHRVFECVRSEAARYGVNVVGSEIVGLTPAEALYMAAEFYLRIEKFRSEMVVEQRLLES